MQSIEHRLRAFDKLADQEQERSTRLEKNLAEYQAQANKPFDHEARMKDLLVRQAQLNASLDLDKNDYQVRDNDRDLPSLSSAA
jgi:HD superfamily phosphohydrolase